MQDLGKEVLEFYFHLIYKRSKAEASLPDVLCLKDLQDFDKNGKFDIFFTPAYAYCFSILFAVHNKERKICVYDPQYNGNGKYMVQIRKHLECLQDSLNKDEPEGGSLFTTEVVENIPQGRNPFESTLFVCIYAELLSRGKSIEFDRNDAHFYRQKMIHEIINKKIEL